MNRFSLNFDGPAERTEFYGDIYDRDLEDINAAEAIADLNKDYNSLVEFDDAN